MRCIISFLLASTAALAEVPAVVTDIPPVQSLVAAVMGDLGQPVLLLDRGASPHSFQLRPSQARAVAEADLVVWIGPELTPWLDGALATRPEDAASLALLAAEGTALRDYGDAGGHDHDDHGDHDHSGLDPHAWLDPDNAQVWLGLIAARLGELDPENAATYTANAAAAATEVAALDAGIVARLAAVKGTPVMTFHDAYGYFGAHYGLNFAGSIALGDAASPGAARLADLRAVLEAGDVLCIFPEVQHDPKLVAQMAEGTGAKIGGALDPVGSSLEPGPGAYAALLTGLAETMATCLEG